MSRQHLSSPNSRVCFRALAGGLLFTPSLSGSHLRSPAPSSRPSSPDTAGPGRQGSLLLLTQQKAQVGDEAPELSSEVSLSSVGRSEGRLCAGLTVVLRSLGSPHVCRAASGRRLTGAVLRSCHPRGRAWLLHTPFKEQQHLHTAQPWSQGAWLSRAEGGQGATLCPCRCALAARAAAQLSRVGKEALGC